MAKVLIYLPVHRTVEAMNTLSLLELQKHELLKGENEIAINFLVGESLIPRARNTIANKFLRSDYDYLLMIDSDLIFEKDTLERLLKHDKELVGANYVHKTGITKWAGKADDNLTSLSPASFIPTGMMLIKKSVLHAIKDYVPVYATSMSTLEYGFFNCMIENNIYLSEDWSFSRRCEKAKIKGYIDNTIRLGHIGSFIYKGF